MLLRCFLGASLTATWQLWNRLHIVQPSAQGVSHASCVSFVLMLEGNAAIDEQNKEVRSVCTNEGPVHITFSVEVQDESAHTFVDDLVDFLKFGAHVFTYARNVAEFLQIDVYPVCDFVVNGLGFAFISWMWTTCSSRSCKVNTTPVIGSPVSEPLGHPNSIDGSMRLNRRRLVRRSPPMSPSLEDQFRAITSEPRPTDHLLVAGGAKGDQDFDHSRFDCVYDPDIAPHCLYGAVAYTFQLSTALPVLMTLRHVVHACLVAACRSELHILGHPIKEWAKRAGYLSVSSYIDATLLSRPGNSLDLAILAMVLGKDYVLINFSGETIAQSSSLPSSPLLIHHHRNHFMVVRHRCTISPTLPFETDASCLASACGVGLTNTLVDTVEVVDLMRESVPTFDLDSPPLAQHFPVEVWDKQGSIVTIYRVPPCHSVAQNSCIADTTSASPCSAVDNPSTSLASSSCDLLFKGRGKKTKRLRKKRRREDIASCSPKTQTESPENSDVEHLAEQGLILDRQGVAVNGDESVAVVVHRHVAVHVGALIKAYQKKRSTPPVCALGDRPPKHVCPGAFMVHFMSPDPTICSLKNVLKRRLRYHYNKLVIKVDEDILDDECPLAGLAERYLAYETNKQHVPASSRSTKKQRLHDDLPEGADQDQSAHQLPSIHDDPDDPAPSARQSSDPVDESSSSSSGTQETLQEEQIRLLRAIADNTQTIVRLLQASTPVQVDSLLSGSGRDEDSLLQQAALRRVQGVLSGVLPEALLLKLLKSEKRNQTSWIKAATDNQLIASVAAACKRSGAYREARAVESRLQSHSVGAPAPPPVAQPPPPPPPQHPPQSQQHTQVQSSPACAGCVEHLGLLSQKLDYVTVILSAMHDKIALVTYGQEQLWAKLRMVETLTEDIAAFLEVKVTSEEEATTMQSPATTPPTATSWTNFDPGQIQNHVPTAITQVVATHLQQHNAAAPEHQRLYELQHSSTGNISWQPPLQRATPAIDVSIPSAVASDGQGSQTVNVNGKVPTQVASVTGVAPASVLSMARKTKTYFMGKFRRNQLNGPPMLSTDADSLHTAPPLVTGPKSVGSHSLDLVAQDLVGAARLDADHSDADAALENCLVLERTQQAALDTHDTNGDLNLDKSVQSVHSSGDEHE
eukprot:1144224-Amphidinium_carterae.1